MNDTVRQFQSICEVSGFPMFGIVRATDAPHYDHFLEWIDRGYHGSMLYLPKRREAYKHPRGVLEGCESVVMLGIPYEAHPDTWLPKSKRNANQPESSVTRQHTTGRIGNYASAAGDYHDVIREKLNSIVVHMSGIFPNSSWRGVVDTAPLLERDFARLAGLGWIGKNTLLLNRDWGSYFYLAALLTDEVLETRGSMTTDHCGNCRACLDACPTQAFPEPHVLNASRCISYLTIEHRGTIDPELRPQMEDWLFGCDVCQIVCPWNRKRDQGILDVFRSDRREDKTSVEHWLQLNEEEFRRLYRHTPFYRTKLAGMQRNALIVAANTKRVDLLELIESFCLSDDPCLAETAEWATKCLKGWSA